MYRPPRWVRDGAEAQRIDCLEAMEFAETYAPMLEEMGRLTLLDTPAFTRMAVAWGKMMEAAAVLSEEGLTLKATERGKEVEKRHPASMIYQANEAIVRQGFSEFGMTPQARRILKPAGADVDTPDNAEHSGGGLLD